MIFEIKNRLPNPELGLSSALPWFVLATAVRLSDEGAVCRENNSFADIIVHLKTETWYTYILYRYIDLYWKKEKIWTIVWGEKCFKPLGRSFLRVLNSE